jgi:hypothetical protein
LNITLRRSAVLGSAVALVGALAAVPSVASVDGSTPIQHVLIVSVNGLHQTDAIWFVDNHPRFQPLLQAGIVYPQAETPVPSDAFAASVSQLTGGTPGVTGVYGQDTFDHALLPAGTTDAKARRGAQVNFGGSLDKNERSIAAGQHLAGLPDSILSMTGTPQSLINHSKLPISPATMKPVTPNKFLKVNTIFNVAHQAGLRTAWIGDHPSDSILGGTSGTGIDDLFTPELDSQAPTPFHGSWAKYEAATRLLDNYKAEAVINEIDGFDHTGTKQVGMPAIFGVQFDSVATAQKEATSFGQPGGYQIVKGESIPGPLLQGSISFLDSWLGRFVSELAYTGMTNNTTIILTGTNGDSPQEPQDLTRINAKPIIHGLDKAWAAGHRRSAPLVAFSSAGDSLELWLSNRSQHAADFAKAYLKKHKAIGTKLHGRTVTLAASGTSVIHAGAAAARYFGTKVSESRHPDVFAAVQHGVVYNAGKGQIGGQGGADLEDRSVPLIILDPAATPSIQKAPVLTTQLAPTVLAMLGLSPSALQAVQIEHTKVLPGS